MHQGAFAHANDGGGTSPCSSGIIRRGTAILAPLAKLACAPTLIILLVLANDGVMANDLDDLDETEGGCSRRRAASWSSSTSDTQP